MGTKRDVFSGKFDSRGRKIMKSSKSMQNADTKSSAIKNSVVPVKEEISDLDQYINDVVESGDSPYKHKDELISLGVDPKVFGDFNERAVVANSGKHLDILIHDRDEYFRIIVARKGFGLEKLIDDKNQYVRAAVAIQGFGLEKLVDDESHYVRRDVARQGFGLEKLVDDENEYVRKAVAEQGYGLEKLIDDENEYVREAARSKMAELRK